MSTTFRGAISAGRVIDGRFPLLQELGGTARSLAYLTELDDGRTQRAAIKIFPFESVDVCTTLARWDVAKTLSHRHLMPLFYAGHCEVDGETLCYVVTEYADEILSQILPERPLSPEEVREMVGPVLEALSYLHKRCLTHGHLRPTNIMAIDDRLKLSPDFGWCSRTRDVYDPPEASTGIVTPAADIWSLGILLVEALTQRPPEWDRSQGGEPKIPADLPEPFFTICRECLRTDPERRCTLADIKAHLNVGQNAESGALPAETAGGRTAKPSHRMRTMILGGAVVAVSLIVATFKFGWDLTPYTSAPAPQHEAPAPTATLVSNAATTPAQSAAPNPEPATKPAPAAEPAKGQVAKGSVAHQALPDTPKEILGAIRGHINVRIRVEVDRGGNVSQATVDSPGTSRYFTKQALQAARNWKFTPAKVDGRAAASSWLLQFEFGESQCAVTQSEESP